MDTQYSLEMPGSMAGQSSSFLHQGFKIKKPKFQRLPPSSGDCLMRVNIRTVFQGFLARRQA
jgi:hypothetical protein